MRAAPPQGFSLALFGGSRHRRAPPQPPKRLFFAFIPCKLRLFESRRAEASPSLCMSPTFSNESGSARARGPQPPHGGGPQRLDVACALRRLRSDSTILVHSSIYNFRLLKSRAGRSLRPAEARIFRCLPPQASSRKAPLQKPASAPRRLHPDSTKQVHLCI